MKIRQLFATCSLGFASIATAGDYKGDAGWIFEDPAKEPTLVISGQYGEELIRVLGSLSAEDLIALGQLRSNFSFSRASRPSLYWWIKGDRYLLNARVEDFVEAARDLATVVGTDRQGRFYFDGGLAEALLKALKITPSKLYSCDLFGGDGGGGIYWPHPGNAVCFVEFPE